MLQACSGRIITVCRREPHGDNECRGGGRSDFSSRGYNIISREVHTRTACVVASGVGARLVARSSREEWVWGLAHKGGLCGDRGPEAFNCALPSSNSSNPERVLSMCHPVAEDCSCGSSCDCGRGTCAGVEVEVKRVQPIAEATSLSHVSDICARVHCQARG